MKIVRIKPFIAQVSSRSYLWLYSPTLVTLCFSARLVINNFSEYDDCAPASGRFPVETQARYLASEQRNQSERPVYFL